MDLSVQLAYILFKLPSSSLASSPTFDLLVTEGQLLQGILSLGHSGTFHALPHEARQGRGDFSSPLTLVWLKSLLCAMGFCS